MSTHNNFDSVARIYDKLARLVFGKSMADAQTIFLQEIEQRATVLILGGGTGWLLAEVLRTNLKCKIWYVEASSRMIALSKKKIPPIEMSRVNFIQGTEDSIPAEITFDVVLTPFYLDLFVRDHCHRVIEKIKASLHPKGIWVVTDFINTTGWHFGMLFVMYRFFEITSNIEASKLPDWQCILKESGLTEIRSTLFYRGFIKSALVSVDSDHFSNKV